jgi:hypothetical protein
MRTFKLRVYREVGTYCNVDLSDQQIQEFKNWYLDGHGGDEIDIDDMDDWDPNIFNDYLEEMGIEKTIIKEYPSTEVQFID